MDYLERAARDGKENYLAIEIVLTDDGPQFKATWPDDPLIAQRLFAELEYQYKRRVIDATAQQRDAIKEAHDKMVKPANKVDLAALNGRHKRS